MRTPKLPCALLLAAACTVANAQNTYSLVASDFSFDPLVLNINTADTVRIYLNPGHSFRGVSQANWDLNVGSIGIGWDFPQTSELTVHDLVTTIPGTIWYVCVEHVNMGMKGRIIVSDGTIGMAENGISASRIYPNPTTGQVRVIDPPAGAVRAQVLDATGRICSDHKLAQDGSVDLRTSADGAYCLQLLDQQGRVILNNMIMLQAP